MAGGVIQVFSSNDYITGIRIKEARDTIDNDGFFELTFYTRNTKPVFLKTGNIVAQLYVKPNYVCNITIPEINQEADHHNGSELPVSVGLVGADNTDLNMLVYDYQELANSIFIPDNGAFVSRASMFRRIDSLKKLCDIRFAHIDDVYFNNFILYSIAALNANVSRGESYLINSYILNKPVLYNSFEYMKFFNSCFKGYLNTIATGHKGQTLYNIINVKVSYPLLYNFLKDDKFLVNDSLKELVMLGNLWEFYTNPEFNKSAIENIVSQINLKTKIAEHRHISSNMLAYFNNLQEGSLAPDFSARNKDGKIASLSAYKNHWVYLNFFSTNNIESLKEMPKIALLKKKYGNKVVFVSVCLDDSLKSYTAYLRANPKFDWQIWYNHALGLSKTARENYNVTGHEAYFLIANGGYLAQSPALAPSAGIEYRFNAIFKIKKRNTKTGIR